MTQTKSQLLGPVKNIVSDNLTLQGASNTSSRVSSHGFICRDNWGIGSSLGNGMTSPGAGHLMFTTNSTESLRLTPTKQYFYTDGSLRMYLNETGLGVNTSTVTGGRLIHAHNTGAGSSYFQSTNSGTGEGSSAGALFGMSGTTCYAPWNYTNGNVVIATNSTPALTITNTGDVTINNGNLVVASGHGIDFSATGDGSGTMNSELLDDYEEGTYDATITMGGNTPGTVTLQTSYDTLSYTKIGRMVYVTGQIRVASVSSPVGGTQINLPFTVRNSTSLARGGGTVALYITGQAHYYWPLVYQIAESTSIINITHNATGYFLPAANNEYAISIMYIVA